MRRRAAIPANGFARVTAAALACTCVPAGAATITVDVVDERGAPVAGVAVYATSTVAQPRERRAPTAVMDQANNAFVPHLLVVEIGTEVLFPNSDTVSHHVYSFSDAKSFELGLYKGNAYPPVRFDRPGIVVLGCNIHDGMLGYVVVVDTPHFALTDDHGTARLDGVAAGDYVVDAWTPRVRPSGLPGAARITVTDAAAETVFTLRGKLAPDHDHTAAALSWDRY